VGDKIDAPNLALYASFEFVPKNKYLGKIVANKMTGPTMAANFEFEKKTLIKKERFMRDKWKRKK
jgi:hypothetical protein